MKQRLVFTTSMPIIKAEKSIFKVKNNFNFENFKVLSAKNSCCFSAFEIATDHLCSAWGVGVTIACYL